MHSTFRCICVKIFAQFAHPTPFPTHSWSITHLAGEMSPKSFSEGNFTERTHHVLKVAFEKNNFSCIRCLNLRQPSTTRLWESTLNHTRRKRFDIFVHDPALWEQKHCQTEELKAPYWLKKRHFFEEIARFIYGSPGSLGACAEN